MYKKFEIILPSLLSASIVEVTETYANGYHHYAGRVCVDDGYATFRSDEYGDLPLGNIKEDEAQKKIHAFIRSWRVKNPLWEDFYISANVFSSDIIFKNMDPPEEGAYVLEEYLNGKTVPVGIIKPVDGVMKFNYLKKDKTIFLGAISLCQAKEKISDRLLEEYILDM